MLKKILIPVFLIDGSWEESKTKYIGDVPERNNNYL
jgi:hypothetical protein